MGKPGGVHGRITVKILSFILTAVLIHSTAVTVRAEEAQKLRVGYFSFDGYHMTDDSGRRSGYGYDYLQYLARYGNFTYEYVGYDKSWSEMQDMLERGEIDILTSAQKTRERLERFDFSSQSIGSSAATLTVLAGDDRYMTDDYARLDGIRVGLLRGSSRNQGFAEFAQKYGFSYQPVYFDAEAEMERALHTERSVDALLTSNLRKAEGEWTVAVFDARPFYIMVKKGNSSLLDRIDGALDKLAADYPELPVKLFNQYYSAESGDGIAYTSQERAYIQSFRESGQHVRVTVNSERAPVSYFKNGEAAGIVPEAARLVMERTGLPYEFVGTPPTVDAREILRNETGVIRFDGTADFSGAEEYGFRVTDPYMRLSLSSVTLKKLDHAPRTAAIMRNTDLVEEYVRTLFPEKDIYLYDSVEECVKAVAEGKQDAAFLQTYVAQRLVVSDVRNRLKEQLVPGYEMKFAASVRQDDALLYSILSKAVRSLGTEDINSIILEQSTDFTRNSSLLGYLYDYPVFWLLLLASAACFAIMLLMFFFRRKTLRLERERNREMEKFITYVCLANDEVIEAEPSGNRYRFYRAANGRVSFREEAFDGWKSWREAFCPEDREQAEAMVEESRIRRLTEAGEEAYIEGRVRRSPEDGYKWCSFLFQGVPQDDEHPARIMIFVKNIEKTKREEQEKRQALTDALAAARQAAEAKSAFMSRMSHEIRTPLNAIIGYLSIAAASMKEQTPGSPANGTESAPPEYKALECLEKSDFAAHHLLNVINDVLDISAIESGRMKIAHEPFNIRELLAGTIALFRSQAEEKGIEFAVRLKNLTEENLVGDCMRLNQILMNLFSNAVKFTPPGGVIAFNASQKAVSGGKAFLQLEVADNGIGMSEEYKKRLFQPFEQQDAMTAQKFGGTGLGLSITQNLTAMMEGRLDVSSREGEGTRITVNLSFDIAQDCGEGKGKAESFSGLYLLGLLSRNADCVYLKSVLERFGVAYDVTFDPKEAVRLTAEAGRAGRMYDICLLDWDIPETDIPSLAERIRAESGTDKPLLAIAAYEAPQQAKEWGIKVLRKPVFQSALFDILTDAGQAWDRGTAPASEENDFDLMGARVLLAEDNAMNMEIAVDILESYGLLVDGAANGREAVDRFAGSEEGRYLAVLMDIQMPVMNGFEAAQAIRSCGHPQAASIPVIALSADAFTEDINRAIASGMNCHVPKPVDFERLCRILSEYLPGNRGKESAGGSGADGNKKEKEI